ncbi:MAG: hypothetical protein IPJ69_12490 [Deltaproteobacteria bacterium]|nr:MAG: hypothetical protein IPJ69_12490 [Deltaproteobacteria bacterium]
MGGSEVTASSEVIDAQIYHNSMGSCPGQGHLQANVRVYAATGLTTSGVVLSGGTSPVTLSAGPVVGDISTWTITGDSCVTLPSDVDYTVTATMSNASTVTLSKTVPHRSVDEAAISLVAADGTETPFSSSSPVYKVPVARPTFKWTPAPGTPTSDSVNGDVPENTKVKFIFELAYTFSSDFLAGHSGASVSPINYCGTGGSGNKLMDKNYFVSDTDCDIAACLASIQEHATVSLNTGDVSTSGIETTDIVCRTNIQTFLVDDLDNIIGQAAGNFRNYCVDADGDEECD